MHEVGSMKFEDERPKTEAGSWVLGVPPSLKLRTGRWVGVGNVSLKKKITSPNYCESLKL